METYEPSLEDRERDLLGEFAHLAGHLFRAVAFWYHGDPNGVCGSLQELRNAADDAETALHAWRDARWPERPE